MHVKNPFIQGYEAKIYDTPRLQIKYLLTWVEKCLSYTVI